MGRLCEVADCTFGKNGKVAMAKRGCKKCLLHDCDRLLQTLEKRGGKGVVIKMIRLMHQSDREAAGTCVPDVFRESVMRAVASSPCRNAEQRSMRAGKRKRKKKDCKNDHVATNGELAARSSKTEKSRPTRARKKSPSEHLSPTSSSSSSSDSTTSHAILRSKVRGHEHCKP